jgi:hypothetical protein
MLRASFGDRDRPSGSGVTAGRAASAGVGGPIMTTRSATHRKQLGITVQELLLVMAIFSMFIVSIPNLSGFHRVLKARAAVNEISATLNLARQLAVRSGASHVFIPIAADNTWQLRNMETDRIVRHGELPNGVTHSVLSAFQFDKNGQCLNPTLFDGTRPTGQYLQMEADLLSGRKVRYTLTLSPISRVTTTAEHFES